MSEQKARGPKKPQLRSLKAVAVISTHGVPEALRSHGSLVRARPLSQPEGDTSPQCMVRGSHLGMG
jgi:hypothetical protein